MKRTIITSLVALLLIAQPTFAATDVKNDDNLPASLVSYWRLEEASGTRNAASSTNNLTDNNTVTSGTGKQGTAADFELDTTEFLSIADASQTGLDITSSMTIAAWVNFETVPGAARVDVVSKFTSGANRSYQFQVGDGNNLTLNVQNNSTCNSRAIRAWTPSAATWYHIAGVYDDAADTVKVFVNGAQQGTTATSQTCNTTNGTAPFHVGSNASPDAYMDGLIDEVGIWSRALGDAEISELYNGGAGLPYEAAAAAVVPMTNPPIIFD